MGKEEKEYGKVLRRWREDAGLTRTELAEELSLSEHTIKQVELGYQALGAANKRRAEALFKEASGASSTCMAEWFAENDEVVRAILGIALAPDFNDKRAQLSEILSIGQEQAAVVIVRETMCERMQNSGGK